METNTQYNCSNQKMLFYGNLSSLQKKFIDISGITINIFAFIVNLICLCCVKKQALHKNRITWDLICLILADFLSSMMLLALRLMTFLGFHRMYKFLPCWELRIFLMFVITVNQLPMHAMLLLVYRRYQKLKKLKIDQISTQTFFTTFFLFCILLNVAVNFVTLFVSRALLNLYCFFLFCIGCYFCVASFRLIRTNGFKLGTAMLKRFHRAMRLSTTCLSTSIVIFCMRYILMVIGYNGRFKNAPFTLSIGFNMNSFPVLCNGILFLIMDRYTNRLFRGLCRQLRELFRPRVFCTTDEYPHGGIVIFEQKKQSCNEPVLSFKVAANSRRRKINFYPN